MTTYNRFTLHFATLYLSLTHLWQKDERPLPEKLQSLIFPIIFLAINLVTFTNPFSFYLFSYWTGLKWTGLHCTGLHWTALDWTVLYCTVLYVSPHTTYDYVLVSVTAARWTVYFGWQCRHYGEEDHQCPLLEVEFGFSEAKT